MSKRNRTDSDLVVFRVTAPAGLYLPGFGSREYGETYTVTIEQAKLLEAIEGLGIVQPGETLQVEPEKREAE